MEKKSLEYVFVYKLFLKVEQILNLVAKIPKSQYILYTRDVFSRSGLSVCQWSERPGFNPMSHHTKDFKNGT